MTNFKNIAFVLLLLAVPCEGISLPRCTLIILNNQNQRISLSAELAATEADRSRGLMFRKSLPASSGMLFVFKYEQMQNFWMKNTYIPLSIAYIDSHGVIREIYDMKPIDVSITYPSVFPAQYALEVNRGWFAENNITRGCRILLNGCIGKQDSVIGR